MVVLVFGRDGVVGTVHHWRRGSANVGVSNLRVGTRSY